MQRVEKMMQFKLELLIF